VASRSRSMPSDVQQRPQRSGLVPGVKRRTLRASPRRAGPSSRSSCQVVRAQDADPRRVQRAPRPDERPPPAVRAGGPASPVSAWTTSTVGTEGRARPGARRSGAERTTGPPAPGSPAFPGAPGRADPSPAPTTARARGAGPRWPRRAGSAVGAAGRRAAGTPRRWSETRSSPHRERRGPGPRSARMSSGCSRPTESRTRSSVTPVARCSSGSSCCGWWTPGG
jgi:hypothetical protein